jgi:hypothetical protein
MMIKSTLILAAVAVSLAACAQVADPGGRPAPPPSGPTEGFDPATARAPTLCEVKVFVLDDQITVDQEPSSIRRCGDATVRISWMLPARMGYTFPDNGITFNLFRAPAKADCKPLPGREVFTCLFPRPEPGARYIYTVRVLKHGVALPALDPMVFSN